MKRTFTLVVSLLLVIFIGNVTAQAVQDQKGTVPMKTPNSVTYGSDVIINYDLSQNQRSACVSVAFNGWLYAAYTVSSGGLQVAKSVDNGATWTISGTIWGAYIFPKIDIVVTGNTVGTLSVWVGYICYDTFSPTYWYAGYEILDGNLNDIGSDDLDNTNVDFYTDVAISSDYRYPAFGAAPYSIGLLYGKRSSVSDSLIFFTTWDGGTNFNARLIVTATAGILRLGKNYLPREMTGVTLRLLIRLLILTARSLLRSGLIILSYTETTIAKIHRSPA